MKKHYSIKATLITIFSMLGSICAADKGATHNFYKLFWKEGKEATYSKRDTKNYIVVHEDCTPKDIRYVLMNEKLYKWWQRNKHKKDNNYNPKDVYITLFSEEGIRINSNYNCEKNNGEGYIAFWKKNDYNDNNNDTPVKDLIKTAKSKQQPIINTSLNSSTSMYVIIGTKIMLTSKVARKSNNDEIEKLKKTGIEKREVKKNNKIIKDNKGNLTNNISVPIAAITSLNNNKALLNSKDSKAQSILEKGKLNNNNNLVNNRVDNNNNIKSSSNELLNDTDNEVQSLQENKIIGTQESHVQINNKNDSSDKSMIDKSNNIKSSINELLDDTDNEVKPPQENKIIETQESHTQTDNKDNINEEDLDDDTIDNNNKNNKQSKTEKSNTNEELIHPEYKEVSSDIEEEDDELLNNDDEGKNKKLTVGKVIAFLTVIALFGIGGFYIYKNGHKLTKLDVKKKKKKQQ